MTAAIAHEQTSFDRLYAPSAASTTTWQDELRVLGEAVAILSLKDVCYELNANKSLVSEALKDNVGKHWQAEWTHVVIAMLARRFDQLAGDCLRSLLRVRMGAVVDAFDIVEHCELTPAERAELDRLQAKRARSERAKGKGR